MKILYFDCSSGISGDMVISAFLDLGLDLKLLNLAVRKLGLPERPEIKCVKSSNNHLTGTQARVIFEKSKKQIHRSYKDISRMIKNSALKETVKGAALKIFELIGGVESKIHGVALSKIHFHEIGGVDSIADIVAACECFDAVGPAKIYFSKLPFGGATVKSQHGILPLPAPAASEILKGIPIYGVDVSQELVTPTGAAIVKTFADGFVDFPPITVEKIGTGMGTTSAKGFPGVLRIFEGKSLENEHDRVFIIDANIDDLNPEFYGHVFETLFEEGALDVSLTPILMKKGRPAQKLSVICDTARLNGLLDAILSETTTTGLRYYPAQRKKLKRESVSIMTPYGRVNVKRAYSKEGIRLHPEYESVKKIAKAKKVSINKVYTDILGFISKSTES